MWQGYKYRHCNSIQNSPPTRRGIATSTMRKIFLRSELIAIAFFFTFSLCSLDANLLIVFLQGCQILTCFREFSLFHALSNIPMHKSALRVHKIKLVVDAGEHLSNRSGVAYHANCPHDFGKITTWHDSWWLVVDATFKSCRGPIHNPC